MTNDQEKWQLCVYNSIYLLHIFFYTFFPANENQKWQVRHRFWRFWTPILTRYDSYKNRKRNIDLSIHHLIKSNSNINRIFRPSPSPASLLRTRANVSRSKWIGGTLIFRRRENINIMNIYKHTYIYIYLYTHSILLEIERRTSIPRFYVACVQRVSNRLLRRQANG